MFKFTSAKNNGARQIYIVEAGSSATRVNEISINKQNCFLSRTLINYGPLSSLIDFLGHKKSEDSILIHFFKSFIKHIISQLPNKRASIYIGLTGGIRNQIENDKIKQKVVKALATALKALHNPRLTFGNPTMRPLEECRLERLSVRSLNKELDGHIGMGGASIQISRKSHCTSIPMSTGTPLTSDFMKWTISKHEFIKMLEENFKNSESLHQVVGKDNTAKYGGTETIGYVAEAIGIAPNKLIKVSEWLRRLKEFVAKEPADGPNLRNYVSALILYQLLRYFPSSASLSFFEYKQDNCPQPTIEATWSLGALIDTLPKGDAAKSKKS